MLREGFPKEDTFENHGTPGASPPAHKTGLEAGKSSCDPEMERWLMGVWPGRRGESTHPKRDDGAIREGGQMMGWPTDQPWQEDGES